MKDSKNFKNENIENIIEKIYMSIIQMKNSPSQKYALIKLICIKHNNLI